MKLLLDGDIFAYRCSAVAENEDVGIAQYYVDNLLDLVINNLQATEYQFYLTGKNNFRYQVYPEYKANRLDSVKPKHLAALRDYIMFKHRAIMSEGCEADDLMGVAQCAESATERTCIVSLDKDLLMIPGEHYSWEISGGTADKRWTKGAVHQEVTKLQGLKWFYTQMLTGDPSDNVKGVEGIGKVRAAKLLNGDLTEEEMFQIVRDAYGFDEIMLMNADCLWIWQELNGKYSDTKWRQYQTSVS
jgi:5'-3' exonuclease